VLQTTLTGPGDGSFFWKVSSEGCCDPLLFLIAGSQWVLLAVYLLATAGFFMALRRYLCSQCINFACPLNTVDDTVRRGFFDRNPGVAKAWGSDTKGP